MSVNILLRDNQCITPSIYLDNHVELAYRVDNEIDTMLRGIRYYRTKSLSIVNNTVVISSNTVINKDNAIRESRQCILIGSLEIDD